MKKINKIILTSLILILAGACFTITGFILGGKVYGFSLGKNGININAPSLRESAEDAYIEEKLSLEAFHGIDVDMKHLPVKIIPGSHFEIAYLIESSSQLSFEVTDDILTLKEQGSGSDYSANLQWSYFNFDYDFQSAQQYLELHVPEGTSLNDIHICSDYGNVSLEHLICQELSVANEYGDTDIESLTCDSLSAKMEYGSFTAANTAGSILTIDNTYGEVCLSELDYTDTCNLTLSNGDLKINNLCFNKWNADLTYGALQGDTISCDTADLTLTSGSCDIDHFTANCVNGTSKYGNITLHMSNPVNDYGYDLHTKYGSIEVEGYAPENSRFILEPAASSRITLDCESGSISISGS